MTQKKVETSSGSTVVVLGTPIGGEPVTFAYDESIPSRQIAEYSASSLECKLQPDYLEAITESIERSKGLGAGFSIRLGFKELGSFEIEKKPTFEVKKIKKAIWYKPKK